MFYVIFTLAGAAFWHPLAKGGVLGTAGFRPHPSSVVKQPGGMTAAVCRHALFVDRGKHGGIQQGSPIPMYRDWGPRPPCHPCPERSRRASTLTGRVTICARKGGAHLGGNCREPLSGRREDFLGVLRVPLKRALAVRAQKANVSYEAPAVRRGMLLVCGTKAPPSGRFKKNPHPPE